MPFLSTKFHSRASSPPPTQISGNAGATGITGVNSTASPSNSTSASNPSALPLSNHIATTTSSTATTAIPNHLSTTTPTHPRYVNSTSGQVNTNTNGTIHPRNNHGGGGAGSGGRSGGMSRHHQHLSAASRSRFSISNLLSSPFSLATISIAFIAWAVAFIASIIADIRAPFPNFAWWTLVYMFFLLCLIFYLSATRSIAAFAPALAAFLAAGLVFTTSAVNSLVYSSLPSKQAAAAGYILLSILAIVWIFYYGTAQQPYATGNGHAPFSPTSNTSRPLLLPDSYPMKSDKQLYMTSSLSPPAGAAVTANNSLPMTNNANQSRQNNQVNNGNLALSSTTLSHSMSSPATAPPVSSTANTSAAAAATMPSGVSALPSSVAHANTAAPGAGLTNGTSSGTVNAISTGNASNSLLAQQQQQQSAAASMPTNAELSPPTDYPYRAKAIYSYEANPDDANEISFSKNEILEVSDVSGRWWQARKANGETGIAPSNYLILM